MRYADITLEAIRKHDFTVMTDGEFEDVDKAIVPTTIGDVKTNEDGAFDTASNNLDDTMLRIRLLAPSTHHTMGGLKTDTKRHVLGVCLKNKACTIAIEYVN